MNELELRESLIPLETSHYVRLTRDMAKSGVHPSQYGNEYIPQTQYVDENILDEVTALDGTVLIRGSFICLQLPTGCNADKAIKLYNYFLRLNKKGYKAEKNLLSAPSIRRVYFEMDLGL